MKSVEEEEKELRENLARCTKQQLINQFVRIKRAYMKVSERLYQIENAKCDLDKLDILIDTLPEMRKIQCYKDDQEYTPIQYDRIDMCCNPCKCHSSRYHYEYDGKDIYSVCSRCGEDLAMVQEQYHTALLSKGEWI